MNHIRYSWSISEDPQKDSRYYSQILSVSVIYYDSNVKDRNTHYEIARKSTYKERVLVCDYSNMIKRNWCQIYSMWVKYWDWFLSYDSKSMYEITSNEVYRHFQQPILIKQMTKNCFRLIIFPIFSIFFKSWSDLEYLVRETYFYSKSKIFQWSICVWN